MSGLELKDLAPSETKFIWFFIFSLHTSISVSSQVSPKTASNSWGSGSYSGKGKHNATASARCSLHRLAAGQKDCRTKILLVVLVCKAVKDLGPKYGHTRGLLLRYKPFRLLCFNKTRFQFSFCPSASGSYPLLID